ncbi:hypothetical protein [Pseudoxanthomonas sp.]|uniref:hypothetical protein n=1 Tax=Pseudoxanthomonas sp. TaxID=1871049 RepID=UPI002630D4E5|nr:hypothetical protein [Pseudoxanthomonas sp.]WDS34785.1 MAG: hypothetical protein O8I58_10340 [Pseudoxanthomonas sp.]
MRVAAVLLSSLLLSAHAQATVPAPTGVVKQLYRDFAWEAVLHVPDDGLAQQPEAVLLKYFAPKLASLLVSDAACVTRTHEVCRLDFTPLWASQDPAAQDLTITEAGADEVKVQYEIPSTHEHMVLQFRLARTPAGWRVADIVYPEGPSLVALLTQSMD